MTVTARRVALALACAALSFSAAAPARAGGLPTLACAGQGAFARPGTWVDIYDRKLWNRPETTVAEMQRRGTRLLLMQTASDEEGPSVYRPDRAARFIEAAHARRMCVVGWYLPPFAKPARELQRSMGAIRFRTPNGHRLDGFALDIENSGATPKAPLKTRNLMTLSRNIRRLAGATYPFGAITISAVSLDRYPSRWKDYPWVGLDELYDVFIPMGYYTGTQKTADGTYSETAENVALLRENVGREDVPIHLAGGLAKPSTFAMTQAFRQALEDDANVIGASLYDFATTGAEDWRALRGFAGSLGD